VQKRIVDMHRRLSVLDDVVQKRVKAATLLADQLRRSILAKAFAGELVPTEAELARRERRDYEPASALIGRIRQESAAKDKVRKPRSARHR
jgi:type I restriction enzyme S subunit